MLNILIFICKKINMPFKIHSLKLSLEVKEITQYDIKHIINNE